MKIPQNVKDLTPQGLRRALGLRSLPGRPGVATRSTQDPVEHKASHRHRPRVAPSCKSIGGCHSLRGVGCDASRHRGDNGPETIGERAGYTTPRWVSGRSSICPRSESQSVLVPSRRTANPLQTFSIFRSGARWVLGAQGPHGSVNGLDARRKSPSEAQDRRFSYPRKVEGGWPMVDV